MEEILGLEDGDLFVLAQQGPDDRRLAGFPKLYSVERLNRAIEEAAEALDYTEESFLDTQMTSKLVVSEDGTRGLATITKTCQVLGGRDLEHIVEFIATPGRTDAPPRSVAVTGARETDTYAHPDGEMFGYRYELESPAPRGGYVHYGYTHDVPLRKKRHTVSFTGPLREVVMVLEFAPGTAPAQVEEIEEDTEREISRRTISLKGRRRIVISRQNFGPGTLALVWE